MHARFDNIIHIGLIVALAEAGAHQILICDDSSFSGSDVPRCILPIMAPEDMFDPRMLFDVEDLPSPLSTLIVRLPARGYVSI